MSGITAVLQVTRRLRARYQSLQLCLTVLLTTYRKMQKMTSERNEARLSDYVWYNSMHRNKWLNYIVKLIVVSGHLNKRRISKKTDRQTEWRSWTLSAHVHILRTLDCLLWRFTILYRIKLVRDLLTHKITTQKCNKPKIIIYLSKTKEPIRVLYSDNVTIVKHKYKP